MNQSFIELPALSELGELGQKIEKHLAPQAPQAMAPLGYIFGAQCINYFLAYFVASVFLILAFLSVPQFKLAQLLSAGMLFWVGAGLLVCTSFFMCRILLNLCLGRSLGEHIMGIEVSGEGTKEWNAIFWEALHFMCPALWLMELLFRMAGLKFGVPYSFSYKASSGRLL
jgi:hypothetical protein